MGSIIVSVQAGKVQTHILDDGSQWTTGYFKYPVHEPLFLSETGLEGDEQKHTKFHGGVHRSLLAYSAAHYAKWQAEHARDFPYGAFGENLTVTELDEDTVCIGDVYSIGDVVRVEVSAPREPCNQIDKCWGIPHMFREAKKHVRTGWYMRTLATGRVAAGMPMTLVERPHPRWTIREAHEALRTLGSKPDNAIALSQVTALEPNWRRKLGSALS